jgi:hypothetical protein
MTPDQRGFLSGLAQQFIQAGIFRAVWSMPPRLLYPLLALVVAGVWWGMG